MNTQPLPKLGTRFRLARPVDRFDHFIASAGAAGTVVDADENVISLHMDDYLPGAEPWDNEIVWTVDDDYDAAGQPAPRPSVAAAFYRAAEPLSEPAVPADAQTPTAANAEPFERDESEGCRLVAVDGFTDSASKASWFDVYHRRVLIGRVHYHEATRGTSGLPGASHWCARSVDGACVNRVASGISLDPEPQAGERCREAAVALLVAAHVAGVSTSA